MPRPQLSDIEAFLTIVDCGSFSAAAQEMGLTASGVSRIATRLERDVGVPLLRRTTRRLALTRAGETFLPHARGLLDAFETAEAALTADDGALRGHIRVNTSGALARLTVAPAIARFLGAHPKVDVDLSVTDRRIDPVADKIDVTIRVGPLEGADLIGVTLGTVARVIAASPAYLERRGEPREPEDLLSHNCLALNGSQRLARWPMRREGRRFTLPVSGAARADSAEALMAMAIHGLGVARLGDLLAAEPLADGRLKPLLGAFHDPDPQPITALAPPERLALPHIRRLVEALKDAFRSDSLRAGRGGRN